MKKYVFLNLFSGTSPYRGEMRLSVLYPFIYLCVHAFRNVVYPINKNKISNGYQKGRVSFTRDSYNYRKIYF